MLIDPTVVPGLLLLAAELAVLAAVGFLVVRVALGQTDDLLAMAQGLVVGIGLWGLMVNLAMFVLPGMAGATAGWIATLAIGAALAWRAPHRIRARRRAVAGFAVVALALFIIFLAGRQFVSNPDAAIHHGLIATMRAGGPHPPELPWHPGLAAPYHYGFDLLVGLLTPPFGPDPAFVTELLGAYVWMSYALVVGTLLLRGGSWAAVAILAPLLLAVGTQSLLFASPGVVQVPVPAGVPEPGLRASLGTVFVDGVDTSISVPPNIWRPFFPLAYVMALVVLERAAHGNGGRRWPRQVALALLVGFLGLVDEAVAPIVLALWGAFEVVALVKDRRERQGRREAVLVGVGGPALAALLLATGGGVLTGVLFGQAEGAFSLGWIGDTSLRPPLASFAALPGGVGLLGLGPAVVAGGAALLARRDRLSLALAAGSGAFLVAALTLQYEFGQHDLTRLDGHARNFGLLALLLALSGRIQDLRPRWQLVAGALIAGLVVWPAIVSPVRALGLAAAEGIELSNVDPNQRGRREVFTRFSSERIAGYIRDHTPVDARVLSPNPVHMSNATGRPNASGFSQAVQYVYGAGPDYLDAIRYLDPAAIRRMDIAYVHATDAWTAELPDRAQRWLDDPRLFEALVQGEAEALLRVRPAFRELEVAPAPDSYEALRRAVPDSATVYFSPATEAVQALRLASALPQARLAGVLRPGHVHLRTNFGIEPLGDDVPSLVVVPRWFTPSVFPSESRQPVWWNDWVAAYSPDGLVEPVMPFTAPAAPPVSVEVSDGRITDGRVRFTVSLTNRDPDRWNGQDWLVVPTRASVPEFPGFGGPGAVRWMPGEFGSAPGIQVVPYEFDARSGGLVARPEDDRAAARGDSGGAALGAGRWTLVLRLNRAVDRGSHVAHEPVAFIPVLRVELSESGDMTYEVYEGDLNARLRP